MERIEFEQFVKDNFPGCKTNWGWDDSWYYVTTSPYMRDADNYHYEYGNGKIMFHIEGNNNWREVRDWLCNHREKISNEIRSSRWGRNDCCWELKQPVSTDEEIKEGFLRIRDLLQPVIDEFVESKQWKPIHIERDAPSNRMRDYVEAQNQAVTLLRDVSLKDLFDNNLSIPDYQRIYCWRKSNVNQLLRDISEMGNSTYHLGTIILHENTEKKLDIVDGQQRLVTLTLLLGTMGEDYKGSLPLMQERFASAEAQSYIAYNKSLCTDFSRKNKLSCDTLLNKLTFTVLVLKSEDFNLAYTFFSNANSKGKPLSDFSLLKAHHLRYIVSEEQQKHLATRWDSLSTSPTKGDESTIIVKKALRDYVLKLRKWMRGENFDPSRKYIVRDEYVAAPTMNNIPAFGEQFNFYEKIQGGQHFFNYAEKMSMSCSDYLKTPEHQTLVSLLDGESHWRYMEMIDALLFGYYLKFGRQYLAEALFVIESAVSHHRHTNGRANYAKIMEYAAHGRIIMMADQATSPTFFLAELLLPIRFQGIEFGKSPIQRRYEDQVKAIYKKLLKEKRFTDEEISKIIVEQHQLEK